MTFISRGRDSTYCICVGCSVQVEFQGHVEHFKIKITFLIEQHRDVGMNQKILVNIGPRILCYGAMATSLSKVH
jgi:hypothetical protein